MDEQELLKQLPAGYSSDQRSDGWYWLHDDTGDERGPFETVAELVKSASEHGGFGATIQE